MDSHCPWILCINPLLYLDRCIHFSPSKTHPGCSHSLCCIFTIFPPPLHLCIEIILMSWLKFQLEATRIYFWVWWHLICLLQCQWSTDRLSVLRGRCSYMCVGPKLVSSHHWIPWRRDWLPTPVFLPGEFRGQRSLEGYSPWSCKELDTTEQSSQSSQFVDLFNLQVLKIQFFEF